MKHKNEQGQKEKVDRIVTAIEAGLNLGVAIIIIHMVLLILNSYFS